MTTPALTTEPAALRVLALRPLTPLADQLPAGTLALKLDTASLVHTELPAFELDPPTTPHQSNRPIWTPGIVRRPKF